MLRGRLIIPIVVLSIIGIVYGALVTLAQKDMKKLIAYFVRLASRMRELGDVRVEPDGSARLGSAEIPRHLHRPLFLLVGNHLRAQTHPRDLRVLAAWRSRCRCTATLFLITRSLRWDCGLNSSSASSRFLLALRTAASSGGVRSDRDRSRRCLSALAVSARVLGTAR